MWLLTGVMLNHGFEIKIDIKFHHSESSSRLKIWWLRFLRLASSIFSSAHSFTNYRVWNICVPMQWIPHIHLEDFALLQTNLRPAWKHLEDGNTSLLFTGLLTICDSIKWMRRPMILIYHDYDEWLQNYGRLMGLWVNEDKPDPYKQALYVIWEIDVSKWIIEN